MSDAIDERRAVSAGALAVFTLLAPVAPREPAAVGLESRDQ